MAIPLLCSVFTPPPIPPLIFASPESGGSGPGGGGGRLYFAMPFDLKLVYLEKSMTSHRYYRINMSLSHKGQVDSVNTAALASLIDSILIYL